MNADAPMDLVVHANLVGRVLVTVQLNPIHTKVGLHDSGVVRIF